MGGLYWVMFSICVIQSAAIKVKVVMHSDQEDSKVEEDDHTEPWDHKSTYLPFIKKTIHRRAEDKEKVTEYEEEKSDKPATEKSHQIHPNELLFPLIYKQSHINSMFKFGENWYTWSIEKRSDGTKGTNYYICYDEPKRCDEVGWERTDAIPKCAFQIDSLLADDRACVNSFGVEPHNTGVCDGTEQMKVNEIVKACGPRIRSLWRFIRVARRPATATKPADVNSLVCEDEEECYLTIEYRIHHDRITFSLHEPTRGQTFKSALKRDVPAEEEKATTEALPHHSHSRSKKILVREPEDTNTIHKKVHTRVHNKVDHVEGKGIMKEDAGFEKRRLVKNKIKVRDDISEDVSE